MNQKTVIITGGNRGIGLSLTESFVDANYTVVVGARSQFELKSQWRDQVIFVPMDVRFEKDHQKLVEVALERTNRLDVYINNAGYSEWRPIEKIDEDFFDQMISSNLKGAFWGCKSAIPAMKNGGVIINISSIAGKRGSSNNSLYCASKFGMNGLTQALAKEVGSQSIRVNAVCPVLISTEGLLQALESPYSPAQGEIEPFMKSFTKMNTALKRLPTGKEVGAMCVFLASENASAITGQCVNVDCGVFPQ